LILYFASIL